MKIEFNEQELNDLWSALTVWQKKLDQKLNPITHKEIKKLIVKIRKAIKKCKLP